MFKKLFNSLSGNNDEPEKTPRQEQPAARKAVEYNEETLHGTHYGEDDFDAEVARRAEDWIAGRDEDDERVTEDEKRNIYAEYRKEVYREWNDADMDQVVRFEMANSLKYMGVQTSGFIKDTGSNPLLEPVHGISLRDYAAMAIKMTQGVSDTEVLKAMGIDKAIWDELNTIWPQRMGQDTTFTITTLYGQYFAEPATHPKLEALGANVSAEGSTNLDRLKTDRYFYEELTGARQAAYEYGLDGAQWILDNYGINLADFQTVAMQWMTQQNQDWNSEDILHYNNYQQEKQKEYAARFAAEQGGNVADDVTF